MINSQSTFTPIGLDEKLQFLRRTLSYRDGPDTITAVETHMSWVFLAGEFAFKLKKPLRTEAFDFTLLENRERNCREEVRLNTRLAPDVYLDVVSLRRDAAGQLAFDGEGTVVEWLVKMRRLPASRMLDWMIEHGSIKEPEVDATASLLIAFYKQAPAVTQSADEVWQRFAGEHERDAEMLGNRSFDIDRAQADRLIRRMAEVLHAVRPLLQRRCDEQVYVEGHGDLRPEHICLLPRPVIIDCLEFSRDLRLLDPFDEIAFLDLECERLGAAWIGQRFLASCRRQLPHPAPAALHHFYRAARALLRARLALAHLTEADPRTPEKWEPRARHYLALAEAALRRRPEPAADNGR